MIISLKEYMNSNIYTSTIVGNPNIQFTQTTTNDYTQKQKNEITK